MLASSLSQAGTPISVSPGNMAASGLTLDQLQALQAARGSPAFPTTGPSGNGVGARTQLSDVQTRLFLQRAQHQQQQQQQMPISNGNNMNLSRDAMAALAHAAQVAVVQQNLQNQASMKQQQQQQQFQQGGIGPGSSNLQVHQQLQAALQAQLQQQQQAARQQQGQPQQQQHPLNSPAAMFLMQNQLQQQQQQYSMQSNNPTAAAAAAALQGRTLPNGANNLLQLQQAAADIQAGRPPINWSKHVLQNPQTTLQQQQQAQQAQQMAAAQSNPGLLAAALQRHAAANIQSQMQAAQAAQVRSNAAAAANNKSTPAAQLQVLRQLHAHYAQAGNGVDPSVINRAAAMAAQAAQQQQQAQLQAQQLAQQQAQQQQAAQKQSSAQLQALRQALSRNAAGRAALNAANDHLRGNAPRGGTVNMQQLNMQATAQMIMQQQRTAQQQALANASMVQNISNLQHGRSAADRAATTQQMFQNAAMFPGGQQQRGPGLPQPPHMQQQGGTALHQQPQLGLDQFDVTQAQLLINSLQQAKAAGLEPRPPSSNGAPYQNGSQHSSNPGSPPGGPSGNGPLANGSLASKEQRRLALACVALQLARGGMTVQQAIDNGIMGGMSGTDVNFIIECYNAENARMKGDSNGSGGGHMNGMTPQPNGGPPGFSNGNGLAFQQTHSASGSDMLSRLQAQSQASSQFGSPPNSDASASVFEPQGHSPKEGSYSSSNSPPPGSHPFLHQGASSYLTQRSLTEAAAAQPLPRGNTGTSLDSSTTSSAGDRPASGDQMAEPSAQNLLAGGPGGADNPPPGRFDAFVYDFFGGEIPAGMDGELEALQSLSAGQLGGELGGALEDGEGSEGARADDALEEEMLSLIGSDSGEHDDLGNMHHTPMQQQFFQQSKQATQYGGQALPQYSRMPQQGMANGGQQMMMNSGQQQQQFASHQASNAAAAAANAAAVMNAVQQGGRSSAGEVLSRMDAEQLAQFALSPEAAWLQAAAIANKALWEGGEDEEPLSNDDLNLRLANLDLGSGFF